MDCDFLPTEEKIQVYSGYDETTQSIIWTDKSDTEGNVIYQPKYQVKDIGGVLHAFVGFVYMCS
jgi:hypothetical protein